MGQEPSQPKKTKYSDIKTDVDKQLNLCLDSLNI